ncbi:MAG: hypothetical protein ACRDE8_00530, partial [Ginsengibacter sp.]
YKSDPNVNVFLVHDGEIGNCPKKNLALNQLKNTNFYKHLILRKIIDGEFWNGKIYKGYQKGNYIYLGKEKIFVDLPYDNPKSLSEQENKANQLFFVGLKKIQGILEEPSFGDCGNCEFSIDYLSINDKQYEVCKHPKIK